MDTYALIKTVIIDDSEAIRRTIKVVIDNTEDITVAAVANNPRLGIPLVEQHKPDIVIMDIEMPEMSGIEATKEIIKKMPESRVLILSSQDNKTTITDALAAGAKGFVPKRNVLEEIIKAIRTVYEGDLYFAPDILKSLAPKLVEKVGHMPPEKLQQPQELPPEKPLFRHADWLAVVCLVFVIPMIEGTGHWLAHTSLLLLAIALIARPIVSLYDGFLRNRRSIGIFAFAFGCAHAVYACFQILGLDLTMTIDRGIGYSLGMMAGIIALLLMAPAAVTSFQYFQARLGRQWRKIHLLSVPSLGLAIWHTIVVGPHYLGDNIHIQTFNIVATIAIILGGFCVLGLRQNKIVEFFEKK